VLKTKPFPLVYSTSASSNPLTEEPPAATMTSMEYGSLRYYRLGAIRTLPERYAEAPPQNEHPIILTPPWARPVSACPIAFSAPPAEKTVAPSAAANDKIKPTKSPAMTGQKQMTNSKPAAQDMREPMEEPQAEPQAEPRAGDSAFVEVWAHSDGTLPPGHTTYSWHGRGGGGRPAQLPEVSPGPVVSGGELLAEVAVLQAEKAAAEKECTRLHKALEATEGLAQKSHKSLEADRDKLLKEVHDLRGQLSASHAAKGATSTDAAVEAAGKALKSEMASEMREAEKKITKAEADAKRFADKLNAVDKKLSQSEAKADKLQEECNALMSLDKKEGQVLARTTEELSAARAGLEEARGDAEEAKEKLQRVEEELATAQAEAETVQEDKETAVSQKEAVEKERDASLSKLKEMDSLKAEKDNALSEKEDAEKRLKELDAHVHQSGQKKDIAIADAEAAQAAAVKELKEAKEESSSKDARLAVAEAKCANFEKAAGESNELRAKLDALQEKFKATEEKRRLATEEADTLKKDLKGHKANAGKVAKKSADEEAEMQRLRQQAANAKLEVDKMKEEKKKVDQLEAKRKAKSGEKRDSEEISPDAGDVAAAPSAPSAPATPLNSKDQQKADGGGSPKKGKGDKKKKSGNDKEASAPVEAPPPPVETAVPSAEAVVNRAAGIWGFFRRP